MTDESLRIAFWSGPRNVSTALLRSWGNRPDTVVVDEPLYAAYLFETGEEHPLRDDVIWAQTSDATLVIDDLFEPLPAGKTVLYQKHMAHHMLPEVRRDWLGRMRHGFLLRDPAEVIASYVKVLDDPTVEDLGLPQMVEIFETVRAESGEVPPVIDSRDLLTDPRGILTKVCNAFGLEFDERMLSWEAGPRETDGVWAPAWYDNVVKSTGFEPYTPREAVVPEHLADVHAECRRLYDQLREFRIEV